MRANLLRDLDALPAPIRAGITAYPTTVVDALDRGWPRSSRLRRAAISLAVDFETWRSCARDGLTDDEAASLMVDLVAAAEARSADG